MLSHPAAVALLNTECVKRGGQVSGLLAAPIVLDFSNFLAGYEQASLALCLAPGLKSSFQQLPSVFCVGATRWNMGWVREASQRPPLCVRS